MERISVCNFNCICFRKDCTKYFHAIDNVEDRILFRENVYSTINSKDYNETDPEGVRKAPCRFGLICRNKNCNFKHLINAEGREILTKKWYVERKKLKMAKLIEELENDTISKMDAAKLLKELWGVGKKEKEEE
jgi:hypothetical protein